MPRLPDFSIAEEDVAAIAASESLILDDEVRIAILTSEDSIDIQACPGSGKTTLIAAKLMLLAQKWPSNHQGICVLSHTNVAKDQIIDRLNKSNILAARRLLSYPHFIGTIQEFVNRFLALPYLRSQGISDFTIDNDEYVKAARKLLARGDFAWLQGTLNGLGNVDSQDSFLRSTFRFCDQNGAEINISRRPRAWRQPRNLQRAKQELSRLKAYLEEWGVFLFRDMYTHGRIAASENDNVSKSLVARFPYLFVDEMQDTQKFQDELLRSVFPPGVEGSSVQRFGDPDQAIFHGFGNEEPNESFNAKSAGDMDSVVHKSHRFDNNLATKIGHFSFNEVPLESELSEAVLAERAERSASDESFEHTVIVFDDDTTANVLEAFSQVVSRQFNAEYKQSKEFSVKAVGAVGNEIDPAADQLKLGHYYGGYDKEKTAVNFKESSLLEAVRHCRQSGMIDWGPNYRFLIKCILRLLRLAGKVDEGGKNYSARSLRTYLESKGQRKRFREAIHMLLDPAYEIDRKLWTNLVEVLTENLELGDISAEGTRFLEFTEEADPPEDGAQAEQGELEGADQVNHVLTAMPENRVRHQDGFLVELSTIHGVKGETHDATLVLETKNYCFDLEAMLPYLVGELPSEQHPNQNMPEAPHATRAFKPNRRFMRQFYVAMSRPKHLLCLALHRDRLSPAHELLMRQGGWRIEKLFAGAGE